jgi:hypothetical protein
MKLKLGRNCHKVGSHSVSTKYAVSSNTNITQSDFSFHCYCSSQEAKLNLTKINVATALLLLFLLQYINITEQFFFLDPLNLFVLKFWVIC